jgi:hypothetical protein
VNGCFHFLKKGVEKNEIHQSIVMDNGGGYSVGGLRHRGQVEYGWQNREIPDQRL